MLRICVAVPLHFAFRLCFCLRSGLCFETLRLRFACVRSGRTPKVSCSLNGTRAKIVNCHLVNGSAQGTMEGQPWDSKLTPTIKDEAIAELARRYGGGASEPITLIGGLQPQEEGGAQG